MAALKFLRPGPHWLSRREGAMCCGRKGGRSQAICRSTHNELEDQGGTWLPDTDPLLQMSHLYDRDSKIVLPEGVAIIFKWVSVCKMHTAPGIISKVPVIQNVIVEPGNMCTPIRSLSLDSNLRMSSRGWRWLSRFWSQNLHGGSQPSAM